MKYTCEIDTPLGKLMACAEDDALVGLWFVGQKYYPLELKDDSNNPNHPVLGELQIWLKNYCSGQYETPKIKLKPQGSPFREKVWNKLLDIPFGKTVTYGAIAKTLNIKSAQAIGNAVGHNPISILIPCHRVIGFDGKMIGYAGGLEKKIALLKLEGHSFEANFSIPVSQDFHF